jgi:hypothetical protein
MPTPITPARYIRERVFHIETQTEFGELIGHHPSVICRFECGVRPLTRRAQESIRAAAKKRGIKWNDRWFFEVPNGAERRVA